eukprot:TRINITY_DN9428_c0_g1_i2.p1 TRINITY_DN9428_c0_g1~~TRINITY_DN9428_c0_g1_i2.p1  ORF type:complete len:257 (+),score=21.91 TRINITY_DN9428_c0_g1_i2:64-834(+)
MCIRDRYQRRVHGDVAVLEITGNVLEKEDISDSVLIPSSTGMFHLRRCLTVKLYDSVFSDLAFGTDSNLGQLLAIVINTSELPSLSIYVRNTTFSLIETSSSATTLITLSSENRVKDVNPFSKKALASFHLNNVTASKFNIGTLLHVDQSISLNLTINKSLFSHFFTSTGLFDLPSTILRVQDVEMKDYNVLDSSIFHIADATSVLGNKGLRVNIKQAMFMKGIGSILHVEAFTNIDDITIIKTQIDHLTLNKPVF